MDQAQDLDSAKHSSIVSRVLVPRVGRCSLHAPMPPRSLRVHAAEIFRGTSSERPQPTDDVHGVVTVDGAAHRLRTSTYSRPRHTQPTTSDTANRRGRGCYIGFHDRQARRWQHFTIPQSPDWSD